MEEFISICDILSSLNVKIVIEPGIEKADAPDSLLNTVEYWRNELETALNSGDEEYRRMVARISEAIGGEAETFPRMIRGRYEHENKVIKLYPEEMKTEYGGNRMNELLVSTLAHEAMHAYFDRPGHEMFPYIYFVEEPLAEFGMLLCLNETGSEYYEWAYEDVASKKSCYRFGAARMTRHLNLGAGSTPERKRLEAYKSDIPDTSVVTHSRGIVTWRNVFNVLPRYCFDKANRILYLDGDWNDEPLFDRESGLFIHIHIHTDTDHSFVRHVHLEANFSTDRGLDDLLSKYPVTVSPMNKQFTSRGGVPFFKDSGEPALNECGKKDGVNLYEICRDEKWGVIDANLNQVIPYEYDSIWQFDKNDLAMVRKHHKYGLVNLQGKEQVPVRYDHIAGIISGSDKYKVKDAGREFEIDKFGN